MVVLLRPREARKPTNTGRLLPLLLEQAELRLVPGAIPAPPELSSAPLDDVVDPARRPLLLDPYARETVDEVAARETEPRTLLAIDGTWRQARRTLLKNPALARVPRARLAAGPPTRYRLRQTKDEERVSTLEAIARALGALEGPALQAHLEAAFEQFVARSLLQRGAVAPSEADSGLEA